MHFIYENMAVLCVAIVTGLIGWLYGGINAKVLFPVLPWLVLFMIEVLVAFPQKKPGESTVAARERVWSAIKHDPFVWISSALLVILAIPFVNSGLCTGCDRELIAQGIDPAPPVPYIPFCVNRMEHYLVFLWFATTLSAATIVRHSLTRHGKRLLLELIVWNGFALAILGFVQTVAGAEGPLWQPFTNVAQGGTFFSTFGYPNMAGDYFTTMFGLAIALWRRRKDEVSEQRKTDRREVEKNPYRTFWRCHYMLIPATVFFFAALNTLSRAAIMLVSLLALFYFVHAFMSFTRRMHRAERMRKGTITLAIAGVLVFFATISIPEDMQREVDTLNTDAVLERVTGKGQYHARVATEIWKDNFLFGCGGWGYKHFCLTKMTPEELKQVQIVGGINVHNDYLQFLAEHGIIGFGLMLAAVFMLLKPIWQTWKSLIRDIRFAKASNLPAKPVQLFVFPAPAFCALLTALATFVHGFGDCPLRSLAVLTLFFVLLAAIPGFLPRLERA